jgi:hypothetical protein
MSADRYFHPEFGCLAPTPRLRRELRIGFVSMLVGIGIGAVAVTALSIGGRDSDTHRVSAVVSPGSGVSYSAPAQAPDVAGHKRLEAVAINADGARNEKEDATTKPDRNDATLFTGPPGRSGTSAGMIPPGARSDTTPPFALGLPEPGFKTAAAGTFQEGEAVDRPRSPPLSREKPQKSPRTHDPPREGARDGYRWREDRGNGWTRRGPVNGAVRLGHADARDSATKPKGFWAWSR